MTPRRLLALAAAMAATVVLGACGDDSSSSSDVPDDAVAVIGDSEISEQEFDAQVEALRRAQPKLTADEREDLASDPELRKQANSQVRAQALSLLLQAEALEQEADNRGIEVDIEEARQRWEPIARRQFRTEKALRTFLGGQTEQEVVEQIRLQMLAERIDAQIAEEAGGGKKGDRAVNRFHRTFNRRWQRETACRDGLEGAGCPEPTKASGP